MDDVTLKGIGMYLIAILEALVVFIGFMLGKITNGFPIEFAVLVGSLLMSTQILIVLIINKYFKIE
ncbi:unnamed protein product [marine sediment metagenome]|uniref:Uncharacterized protein n=1 Tax=marine sediment metagenome TaxID=412755 RepID=X1CXI7_9ZZZZ